MIYLFFCFLVFITEACLPGLWGGYPAYSGGFYGRPFVGGLPAAGGLPPVGLGPRIIPPINPMGAMGPIGPFRAEANSDQARSVSILNCASFEDSCKWSNTNEEELDWSTVKTQPHSQSWMATLGTSSYPMPSAGALISSQRRGWEGGQLVSDQLPCLPNGIVLQITAWRSRTGSPGDQPRLQVCTRNAAEERLPLVNCNEVPIHNAAPVQVDVPTPSDSTKPTQIILYGNNFAAQEGGAIFIQDIELQGQLNCNEVTVDKHPTLIGNSIQRQNPRAVGPLEAMENPSSQLEDISSPIAFDENESIKAPPPPIFDKPNDFLKPNPSLFEQCLALSCNPSDLSCKFWRSSGNNRWEIGSAGRTSNPLTGINTSPGTAKKFLVAPFLDSHITSYSLVTEKLNIPLAEEVYFCFYEFLATNGLSMSVCTDRSECFYRQTRLNVGDGVNANKENKKWNLRCSRLPTGIYELRVIAENMGDNKGEIGFLPVRLSKDPVGQEFIC
ncbi:unnamed protein product, partial [Mesorhabditis belari]|uniref:MAM domain-containing protein n=1 Tax=Mesorhabditis belari TaxID=2138241 RepID=A0AAF3J6I5_9BILA